MKLKVSFPYMQLSIEVEGLNAIDFIGIAVKSLFKLRKMILNAREENKATEKREEEIN